MAFQLPRFFALKSKKNEKHLRYIHQDIEKLHGILQFSGDDVVSPYAQFQMEAATSCNRRLVHIRSCYNNKYLARADKDHWWIVAGADEPQEDQSLWSCTLYEPQLVQPQTDNNGSIPLIRLRHVQLGHYLKLLSANDFQACLFAHQAAPDTQKFDVFTVKELVLSRTISDLNFCLAERSEMAFQLPRFFALKSKKNEKHLRYIHQDIEKLHGILQFSGDDVVSPYAQFQMEAATSCNRRLVHIRSCYNNKYLARADKDHWWIVAGADEPQEDQSLWSCTLYEPQLVQPQTDNNGSIPLIRLRHVQLGHYLKLLSANDFQACLFAHQAAPDTQKFDVFTVKELVLSRTISDLNFCLAHARIYNHNIDLLVATGEAENCTLEPANAFILLSYIDTKASTWITSVDSVAFTSLIPTTVTSDTLFAVDHNDGGIIGVLGKFNGAYQWGQTHTSQTTIESRFLVVVPPMSKVRVSLLATKASCNIPFYYSQQDTLICPHPRTITYHKEGGVYTGVSFYNFKHKKEEEPLAG